MAIQEGFSFTEVLNCLIGLRTPNCLLLVGQDLIGLELVPSSSTIVSKPQEACYCGSCDSRDRPEPPSFLTRLFFLT